jgi:hypothetical protein
VFALACYVEWEFIPRVTLSRVCCDGAASFFPCFVAFTDASKGHCLEDLAVQAKHNYNCVESLQLKDAISGVLKPK